MLKKSVSMLQNIWKKRPHRRKHLKYVLHFDYMMLTIKTVLFFFFFFYSTNAEVCSVSHLGTADSVNKQLRHLRLMSKVMSATHLHGF